MFSSADLKFAGAMYLAFGGVPLTVLSLLVHFRKRLTKTRLAALVLPYVAWYMYDSRKPFGNESGVMRRLLDGLLRPLWQEQGGRVIFDTPLDAKRTYLFAGAPHGVVALFWILPLSTTRLGPHDVPPTALGAHLIYKIPFLREVYSSFSVPGTPENFHGLFNSQRSSMVIPGGVPEMILSEPGDRCKVFTRHQGFVKVALEHGTPIVPIFSFGETQMWAQKRAPRIVSDLVAKFTGGTYPFLPWGRFLCILPNAGPVVYAVGTPVDMPKLERPSAQDVEEHHLRFYTALSGLVRKYKKEAGFEHVNVEFVGLEQLNVLAKEARL